MNADIAHALADQDVFVFPLSAKNKPATENGFLDASTTHDQISKWWKSRDYLVGIDNGRSGLLVADIDINPAKGKDGLAVLRDHGLKLPRTKLNFRTPGGGFHGYFENPLNLERWADYDGLNGVDRLGSGGYTVWYGDLEAIDTLAELPDLRSGWLCKRKTEVKEQRATISVDQWLADHDGPISPEMLEYVSELAGGFNGHERMRDAIRHIVGLGAQGLSGAKTALFLLQQSWLSVEHVSGDPAEDFDRALTGAVERFGDDIDLSFDLFAKAAEDELQPQDDSDSPWMSAAKLKYKSLPDTQWIVEDILTEGMGLLVADPKVGKTNLAVEVAYRVAQGEPVFNKKTFQRPTLYISMEDTERQIQARLQSYDEGDEPGDFHFLIGPDAETAVKTILKFYETNPLGMVVIDTLVRIMPVELGSGNVYREEAKFMDELRKTIPIGASMLVLHHTNKNSKAESYTDRTSGSNAINGTADIIWNLTRPRNEHDGFLNVTGRGIEEQKIELTSNKNRWYAAGYSANSNGDTNVRLGGLLAFDPVDGDDGEGVPDVHAEAPRKSAGGGHRGHGTSSEGRDGPLHRGVTRHHPK